MATRSSNKIGIGAYLTSNRVFLVNVHVAGLVLLWAAVALLVIVMFKGVGI